MVRAESLVGIDEKGHQVSIAEGSSFQLGNKKYVLARSLNLEYINNEGAGAAFFIADPIHPGKRIRFPPILEGRQDMQQYAGELFEELVMTYDRLSGQDLSEKPALRKDKDELGQLLSVVDA